MSLIINNNKSLITKILICFTGTLLFFTALVFPFLATCLGYEYEETEKAWFFLWICTVVFSVIMVSMLPFLKLPHPKAIKKNFTQNSLSFSFDFTDNIMHNGYTQISSGDINGAVYELYIKQIKTCELTCVVSIRCIELDEIILDHVEKEITFAIKDYRKVLRITDFINVILVVLADKTNYLFRKMVNNPVEQGFKNGRFIAGISFGGKSIYIAPHNNGLFIKRYKALYKLFLNLISTGKTSDRKTGDGSAS